ncbi:FHA domain-containing protein [Aetokthonos hydrillicola Thurmond2011]|jgi:ssDNA-binding Zn-finger/Zn-ribbon topoisomerase 1|uniref:FHA domain-containing protein n=1 Tax=Aetokthonos hydrillicola Thurmond2011 TaxID=2712845 RepID=A0AAP5IDP4_9CYAN|nr:FHA domain-containing protein [Aetokthonos hydrillicola]MBW4585814.1 FHA domain-containing protein [Aetokthonos hydrillicola CCALA 1050]MDR9899317.1 FHA domain-containing protein [Aetokthonos hydrillicola Thurmond2011]
MNALTLQWHDAGTEKTQQIYEQQSSKHYGTIRIGRDPLRCDIVLNNPTVSGLHVEIYFDSAEQQFFIRNLRSQNPPLVDGRQLNQGELPLKEGSTICLGQQELRVTAISIPSTSSVPPTVLIPPPLPNRKQNPIVQQQGVYGLECPKCHKVSSPDYLQVGCPWCGTSLAAAMSVLTPPNATNK